ncbi:serine/threonine protein kinase [Helicocarpus griseus UAMH5409]|uniref:Serine/threonine protein kinase n=1 Tax=Helicocarpus griseus UAMH5409 TaxID=1447875 RepID=A0A2B7XQ71_9EURO|nr:serine/threonine protein kinase [Helicocarpus griseus UAMH5409]
MAHARTAAIEEQPLQSYHTRRYYPARIGQTFETDTGLLQNWDTDEKSSQYTTLKVSVQTGDAETLPITNKIGMLRRSKKYADKFDRPGPCFTRLARDIFEIDGPLGRHVCIAFKTQGASLRKMQEIFPNAQLPKLLVISLVHRLFFSVNWLHATCSVVHTDISPMNVLSEMEDEDCLKDIEISESYNPSAPIVDANGHPVYRSTELPAELSGVPILTDFGQMLPAERCTGDIWCMPDLYRAPEVLLKLRFGFPADMWSIGVMVNPELMEGRKLFDPVDRINNQYVLPLILAQYIGYLGPPPLEMIQKSPLFVTYFDKQEDFATTIPPGDEKDEFLRFIRKLLTWDPEARATTNEIHPDKWLMRRHEDMW